MQIDRQNKPGKSHEANVGLIIPDNRLVLPRAQARNPLDIYKQGRSQLVTALTESRGPGPWGGPGAPKRGPVGPKEEREEERKREEKRKKEEKKEADRS